MTDIRRLAQIIMDRVADQVPELGGRVQERATDGLAYPYVTLGASYGVTADVECIDADDWTLQLDVWGGRPEWNKASLAGLAQKIRAALKGWSDTAEVTMHPLTVDPPRTMDDPDGMTVHSVLLVEAMVEGDS